MRKFFVLFLFCLGLYTCARVANIISHFLVGVSQKPSEWDFFYSVRFHLKFLFISSFPRVLQVFHGLNVRFITSMVVVGWFALVKMAHRMLCMKLWQDWIYTENTQKYTHTPFVCQRKTNITRIVFFNYNSLIFFFILIFSETVVSYSI